MPVFMTVALSWTEKAWPSGQREWWATVDVPKYQGRALVRNLRGSEPHSLVVTQRPGADTAELCACRKRPTRHFDEVLSPWATHELSGLSPDKPKSFATVLAAKRAATAIARVLVSESRPKKRGG